MRENLFRKPSCGRARTCLWIASGHERIERLVTRHALQINICQKKKRMLWQGYIISYSCFYTCMWWLKNLEWGDETGISDKRLLGVKQRISLISIRTVDRALDRWRTDIWRQGIPAVLLTEPASSAWAQGELRRLHRTGQRPAWNKFNVLDFCMNASAYVCFAGLCPELFILWFAITCTSEVSAQ